MKTRIINYGEQRSVTIHSADEKMIVCVDSSNEGYVLLYHGLKTLPKPGDKGRIVFERDTRQGHWQYYNQ